VQYDPDALRSFHIHWCKKRCGLIWRLYISISEWIPASPSHSCGAFQYVSLLMGYSRDPQYFDTQAVKNDANLITSKRLTFATCLAFGTTLCVHLFPAMRYSGDKPEAREAWWKGVQDMCQRMC